MDLTTLAARLRFVRQTQKSLSQATLDRLAGLHRGHVWQIESGDRPNPELRTLLGLSRVLGVSVGWLAAGEAPACVAHPDASSLEAATLRALDPADPAHLAALTAHVARAVEASRADESQRAIDVARASRAST